jgi:hypothetical protein
LVATDLTPTSPNSTNFAQKKFQIFFPKNSPKLALDRSLDLLSYLWFCSNRNLPLVLICNSPTFPQLLVPNFPRIRRISARISAQIDEQPADLIATGSSARKDRKFRPRTGSSAPQDRKFRLAEILTATFVFRFGTNPLVFGLRFECHFSYHKASATSTTTTAPRGSKRFI